MAIHQTERMCVSCRKKHTPSTMRRFVVLQAKIVFDDTIKQPGRGHYVCSDECLERFQKRKLKAKTQKGNN